jgi:putative FmdB family regulatory protein
MPNYDYECTQCGAQFEIMKKLDDKDPKCPECEGCMKKKIGKIKFILKGDWDK